jgi:hypothetical protein
MSEWIKRSERLPDTRRYVLIWNNLHEEIQIGEYIPDFKEWRGQYGADDAGDITHWMELPDRPKLTD